MSETSKTCHNHPERAAIESCEVCDVGLCGYCLYYTDDGQRLCEAHAQQARLSGTRIIPPAVYADGIIASQASAKERESADTYFKVKGALTGPLVIYKGNNQDVIAFTAMLLGLISISMCFGVAYCLPCASAILGLVGLMNAKDAVDPNRTRTQSLVALLTGGLLSVVFIGCFAFCALSNGAFLTAFSANTSTYPQPLPSPTYTFAPAETETPNPLIEPIQRTATVTSRSTPAPTP